MKTEKKLLVLTCFVVLMGGMSLCMATIYTQNTQATIDDMTSVTQKAAPSGAPASRTTIGLGEKVTCSIDPSTWSDTDCDISTDPDSIIYDTIGDRVWAAANGSISPSGVTSVNTATFTASYDPSYGVALVHVYDSKTKFTDDYVQTSITFTIIAPTGETTADNGWTGITAKFESTLTPDTVNFGNINVIEVDGAGSHDACWFAGSTQTKYEALTGGDWPVSDMNVWGDDHLSWDVADVTYYRAQGKAPCSTTLAQEMHVVEGSSGEYTSGNLVITIGTTTVSASRNGVNMSKAYP